MDELVQYPSGDVIDVLSFEIVLDVTFKVYKEPGSRVPITISSPTPEWTFSIMSLSKN